MKLNMKTATIIILSAILIFAIILSVITLVEKQEEPNLDLPKKPVIYLYPEKECDVSVKLHFDGEITSSYPEYDDGWSVRAYPDGTLVSNSLEYSYLFWEGKANKPYIVTEGFCVRGSDTAAFLESALSKLGLSRREANEFIVYWLPLMEDNEYNVISFLGEEYTDSARLEVTPAPDTVIRVFMAYRPSDTYVELPEQHLSSQNREGFTLVEWGGTLVK